MNVLIYFGLLALISFYAAARGGSDERHATLVCIAASIATLLSLSPVSQRFEGVETWVAGVDFATLAAFTVIALRTDRFWPLWVAGLQLTSAIGHLLKLTEPGLVPIAYAAAMAFWSYPILLIIGIGVFRGNRSGRPSLV